MIERRIEKSNRSSIVRKWGGSKKFDRLSTTSSALVLVGLEA